MACRITATELKLLDTRFAGLADPTLESCINTANILINEVLDLDSQACHTDDTLAQTELYLSAFLCYTNAAKFSSEKIGDAQEATRNPGVLLKGLDSNWYGQMAKMMDCSGLLGKLGAQKVTFQPFGKA